MPPTEDNPGHSHDRGSPVSPPAISMTNEAANQRDSEGTASAQTSPAIESEATSHATRWEPPIPWKYWRACGSRLAWWLIGSGLLWMLGFPALVDLTLSALLLAAALVGRGLQLIALSFSLLLGLGFLEVAARILSEQQQEPTYYRPHEKLQTLEHRPGIDPPIPIYKPSTTLEMVMPHGDLFAIEPALPNELSRPRKVRFVTDEYGLRNDHDYRGEQILLLGDSYTVGNGNDQADILANVLRTQEGFGAYSLAHPHDPDHYFARMVWALSHLRLPPSRKFIMLFCEGNDFVAEGQAPSRPLPVPGWYDSLKIQFITAEGDRFRSPPYFFGVTRHLQRRLVAADPPFVDVFDVGTEQLAFLGNYVDMARAQHLTTRLSPAHPPELFAQIAAVFFVPTKYRVYAPMITGSAAPLALPTPAAQALQRTFGPYRTPVIDLTPALSARARELLPQGKFVYFPDDTHWNGEGISVAAAVIARTLSTEPLRR